MLFDWDLWPWMVVEGAGGELAVIKYRFERSMRRLSRELSRAFRGLAVSMAEATRSLQKLMASIPSPPAETPSSSPPDEASR